MTSTHDVVPPTDLLRGLRAIIVDEVRAGRAPTMAAFYERVGYTALDHWWGHEPITLRTLRETADACNYRLMFVSHTHPLTAVALPIIRSPAP